MQYDGRDYTGVKAALLWQGSLFVYRRDTKPGLRFSGMWDFFGGGREAAESPIECLARELREELEIVITPQQVVFSKIFPAMHDPSIDAYFMVVDLTDDQAKNFQFGSEGVSCKFVSIDEFMDNDEVVPGLKPRLQSYLDQFGEKSP